MFFSSCHHISLPFNISTLLPVLCITKTLSIAVSRFKALSTLVLRGINFPPLIASSAVIKKEEEQSNIRSANASGEKPPNTTEWIAPILAQANIAYAASGIMGM